MYTKEEEDIYRQNLEIVLVIDGIGLHCGQFSFVCYLAHFPMRGMHTDHGHVKRTASLPRLLIVTMTGWYHCRGQHGQSGCCVSWVATRGHGSSYTNLPFNDKHTTMHRSDSKAGAKWLRGVASPSLKPEAQQK